jgi:hypothetical protein
MRGPPAVPPARADTAIAARKPIIFQGDEPLGPIRTLMAIGHVADFISSLPSKRIFAMTTRTSLLAFTAFAAVAMIAAACDTASAGVNSRWSGQSSSAGKSGGYGGAGAPIKVSSHVPGSTAGKVGNTWKPGSTGSTGKPGQMSKIECFRAPCNTGSSTGKPSQMGGKDWHPGQMGHYDPDSNRRPWQRPWNRDGGYGGYGVFPVPTETYEIPVPSYVSAPVEQPYVQAPMRSYAVAPVQTYAQPAAAPCTCLTKSYMQDGSVVFADNCTKEQAMAAPMQGPSASVQ